jgi:transposase
MREIVNLTVYVLRGGIPWRMLPPCFAPWQTVYGWFAAWRDAGVPQSINHHLVMLDRELAGREASPGAAVIDSQSVNTTEAGGPRGYGAGRKVLGRKRHAMVDTNGRTLVLQVHPASVQDCDGAVPCCVPRAAVSLLWNSLSPTTPMPATGWRALPASPSRSFASLPVRSASPCIRAAGSSSDASPGSAATAGAGWNGLRHPSHHLVRRDRRGTHLLGAALLAVAEAKSSPV